MRNMRSHYSLRACKQEGILIGADITSLVVPTHASIITHATGHWYIISLKGTWIESGVELQLTWKLFRSMMCV